MNEKSWKSTEAMNVETGDWVRVGGKVGRVSTAGEAKSTVCAFVEWVGGEEDSVFWDSFEDVTVWF